MLHEPKEIVVLTQDRLTAAYRTARDALLAERNVEGYWLGELSSSALSTATAISALSLVGGHEALTHRGLEWLASHQNDDGGWGDTVKSFSNISTTMLCRAACRLAGNPPEFAAPFAKAEAFMAGEWGATAAEQAEAIRKRYGVDHTFSVPILMNSALAGLVPWSDVPALPFELACLPQSWYRLARMPVVSYALPALIAIGQTIFHHRPPRNPIVGLIRRLSVHRSLKVLARIQPESGGFLEATPLTSFVVMALQSSHGIHGMQSANGHAAKVIEKGIEFLVNSARPDGSWPIDSNLSVWVTTLAVNALAAAGDLESLPEKEKTLAWILEQQETERHPYTGAPPGGWGWSHLSGSVPDADDTPGAILALSSLGQTAEVNRSVESGRKWLAGLQNRDGGMPTFCRGWGKLPFDRSGSDLTAHFLRALGTCWKGALDRLKQSFEIPDQTHLDLITVSKGLGYIRRQQRPDGSWLPLWFGNQHTVDEINPTYGTSRVLRALHDLRLVAAPARRRKSGESSMEPIAHEAHSSGPRGIHWLLDNQNDDGGWGGMRGTPSSVEESALAIEVLVDLAPPEARFKVERGIEHLVGRIENGELYEPAPIGFYFAKLWYFEKMYPIVWSVAALGRALKSPHFPFGQETGITND